MLMYYCGKSEIFSHGCGFCIWLWFMFKSNWRASMLIGQIGEMVTLILCDDFCVYSGIKYYTGNRQRSCSCLFWCCKYRRFPWDNLTSFSVHSTARYSPPPNGRYNDRLSVARILRIPDSITWSYIVYIVLILGVH